ncbi:transmembrane protein 250 [Tiliqua scincoides]|uniref:transmembrane protein 250 n=1 Tax=Tiliqua scincoides TaxID=71010 RepID=UPI003461FFC9
MTSAPRARAGGDGGAPEAPSAPPARHGRPQPPRRRQATSTLARQFRICTSGSLAFPPIFMDVVWSIPCTPSSPTVQKVGCLMPVIPIPRRVRSFHGPHTTCLHSACGPVRTTHLVRTKYNNFDIYLKSRWMYGFIRFLLYFSCSLFTSILWVALSVLFCLQYLSIRVFLRFQYKLSIILLLLGRRRVDFSLLNELLIYGIHVTMLLVGGLGWCFMVFVDM